MFKRLRFFFHLGDAVWMRAAVPASDVLPFGWSEPDATPQRDSPNPVAAAPAKPVSGSAFGMVNGMWFAQSAWIAPSLEDMRQGKNAFHAEIVCDGHARHLHSTGIAIGVGRYADEKPIPEADAVERERLFLSIRSPRGGLRRLWAGGCGDIEVTQAQRIQILTDVPLTVFLDGRPATRTPATFTFVRYP